MCTFHVRNGATQEVVRLFCCFANFGAKKQSIHYCKSVERSRSLHSETDDELNENIFVTIGNKCIRRTLVHLAIQRIQQISLHIHSDGFAGKAKNQKQSICSQRRIKNNIFSRKTYARAIPLLEQISYIFISAFMLRTLCLSIKAINAVAGRAYINTHISQHGLALALASVPAKPSISRRFAEQIIFPSIV